MALREEFKQTGIGVIPKDWDVEHLQDGCKLLSGHHILAKYCNTEGIGFPYITGPADFSMGVIQHTKYTDKPSTICQANDILVTVKGSGVGTIVLSDAEYCISRQLMAIRIADWDTKYIYYVLAHDATLLGGAAAGLIPGLSRNDLLKKQIAVPSLPEQQAISTTLGDIDALHVSLNELIAKKRDIKQGAMQELLTGRLRLPGFSQSARYKHTEIGIFPEDWEISPMKRISSMNGRIGWQGLKQSEFTTNADDPYLITGMNFEDGIIKWDEVYHIPEKRYEEAREIQLKVGDVLMTKDGTIGKVLYVDHIPYPFKASLNSHLLVFRPLNNKYVPKFLFYQLDSQTFRNHVELEKSGSTFFGITQEAVGKYNAFLPSLPEQQAIADVLSDMDAEIILLEQQREKTRLLKQGMMQELLTGRIRLV